VKNIIDENTAEFRYKMINNFEELLKGTGTYVLKFFLHVSKEEQDDRLKERLVKPEKNWKYNPGDKETEEHRDDYMKYYNTSIEKCSEHFPWLIVPSDKNWYKEYMVANETVKVLEGMKLKYPEKTN
jgi:polyphosphate kinase 2 (PPK2 family)